MLPDKASRLLPWNNQELEDLLKDLIAHGTEAAKADYKSELELATTEQKADFLKDVSAMANTASNLYSDHGFLIYGVSGKTITGISKMERNTDKLQNQIEQLAKTYLGPMVQLYVIGFTEGGGQEWGVVVLTPNNNKPYMFIRDLQCQDPKRSRRRGEWFIRRGATTDPGLPEDLMLITQQQFAATLDPLRESIRMLQARLSRTEEEYRGGIFKLLEHALSGVAGRESPKGVSGTEPATEDAMGLELPARLKQRLRLPSDKIADELISEATELRALLEGARTEVPWVLQLNNPDGSRKIIELLEEKTRIVQVSLATILLNDHKGVYNAAVLRVVKVLARTAAEPMGVQFNRLGHAIRYYPLGIVLYTVFVCGVAANRDVVLKQILKMPLTHRDRHAKAGILNFAYLWSEARALFNEAFSQRLCEPIPQRIRQLLNDRVGDQLTDLPEPDSFFRGEFVMALAGIDSSGYERWREDVPLPGLYLYLDEANRVITDFLEDHPAWFETLYGRPMNDLLALFDQNAEKAVTPGCIAMGIHHFSAITSYQKTTEQP